jgi:hypothetical protein
MSLAMGIVGGALIIEEMESRPAFLQRPDTARLFYWLCGKADEYATVAGPAWPMRREAGEPHYGAPEDLRET